MMKLDVVIGSGGVLSHAPSRIQAALMMLDGFGLSGVTQIAVDSIFMMPHLGVLASVDPAAAQEIFEHDCLVNICHSVAPVYTQQIKENELAKVMIDEQQVGIVVRDKVGLIPLEAGRKIKLTVIPLAKGIRVGSQEGEIVTEIEVGKIGLILDGRNRPINFASDTVAQQQEIFKSLGLIK
jgi:hypothetical protein